MNSFSKFNKLYLSMYFRGLNKKLLTINTVLIFLPFAVILFFCRKYGIGFELVTLINIVILVLMYYKKFVTDIFSMVEYEIFLAYPVKFKDLFFAKIVKFYINILILNSFMMLSYVFNGLLTKEGILYYVLAMLTYLLTIMIFIVAAYIITFLYYQIAILKNKILKTVIYTGFVVIAMLAIFKTSLLNDIFLLDFLFSRYKIVAFKDIIMIIILGIIVIGIFILLFKLTRGKYEDILGNINSSTTVYKEKKYKKSSIVKALVIYDIKKTLRNKVVFRSAIIGFIMIFGMAIISLSLIGQTFAEKNKATLLLLYIMYGQIIASSIIISFIAFSKSGMDEGAILSMPVSYKEYVRSRIISTGIINIVAGGIIGITSVVFYKQGIDFIILVIISVILSSIAFGMMGLYDDFKKPNLYWVTEDDLVGNLYGEFFMQVGLSSLMTLPLYVLSPQVKWLSLYPISVLYILINIGITIIYYKMIQKKVEER